MEFSLFISTFALIFVAELPDKTAFAALFLATCHHPLAVFIGASAAFTIQSVIAVAFGSFLSLLPPQFIHIISGILFLIFAVMMWRRKAPEVEEPNCEPSDKKAKFFRSVGAAFMTIFVAEWGDLTQLATAALAAKYHAPLTIFTSATLALWAVTAIGVAIGFHMKHRINAQLLQRIAASAFGAVGIGILVKF
jgi:Ca2+/H+ antiporter, TMEM165/GDT1 family